MSEKDPKENQTKEKQTDVKPVKAKMDPVRKWTFILLGIALLLLT